MVGNMGQLVDVAVGELGVGNRTAGRVVLARPELSNQMLLLSHLLVVG